MRLSLAASSMYKICDLEEVNVMTSRSRVRSGLVLVLANGQLFKTLHAYQFSPKIYVSVASWLACPLATLHRSRSSSGVDKVGTGLESSDPWCDRLCTGSFTAFGALVGLEKLGLAFPC